MYTYFLSDVHMGMNLKENWYQDYIHEKYLKSALSYITSKGSQTKDVVILGDLFDNWVYANNADIPDSLNVASKCIECNKALFESGSDGNFITMMNEITGNLYYINGNHDMEISVDTLNEALKPYLSGKKVLGGSDPLKNIIYQSEDQIIYGEHGHEYSLLCQKDIRLPNEVKPLPLGYFISRTVADISKKEAIKQNLRSAAELSDSGNPTFGMAMEHLDQILKKLNDPDLGEFSQAMLSLLLVLDDYDNIDDVIYSMPEMKNGLLAKTAAGFYEWLKTNEVLNEFTPEGQEFYSADVANSLDNVGRNLCDVQEHKIVIMGHTHVPKMFKRLEGGRIYANTGFMCPDLPSMKNGSKFVSFVEVETQGNKAIVRIMKVDPATGKIQVYESENTEI